MLETLAIKCLTCSDELQLSNSLSDAVSYPLSTDLSGLRRLSK